MKRLFRLLTVAPLASALLISTSVGAQEMVLQTGESRLMSAIRNNCETIQSRLRQVHTNDALFRVNAGQVYNNISGQLMARLNSRLALSRVDSTKFVEISGRLDNLRADFAKKHTAYDIDMTELSGINCAAKTTEFYTVLLRVRDSRKEVAVVVKSMNEAVQEYQVAVENLRNSLAASQGAR